MLIKKDTDMKIFAACLLLLAMPLTAQSESSRWHEINDWLGAGFVQLSISFSDNSRKSFQVGIADDPAGKQILEFRYLDSRSNYCNSDGYRDVVITVNEKRVKMKSGCKRLAMAHFITYFPTTEKGREHVVESFRNADRVSARIQGYDLSFPTNGFEEAWGNYGGDAI